MIWGLEEQSTQEFQTSLQLFQASLQLKGQECANEELGVKTQIWGSTFCKSCLLIFLLLALEEPKWYSKPELSWYFNDLGIPSPLYGPPDENHILHMCSKVCAHLSSGCFAIYIEISLYSVAERKPF